MLIIFQTKSYANVTQFGDVALALLALMGRDAKVPGAMAPEEIPDALKKLKCAIAKEQPSGNTTNNSGDPKAKDNNEVDHAISLAHRALPLIELLEAAIHNGDHVMWDN